MFKDKEEENMQKVYEKKENYEKVWKGRSQESLRRKNKITFLNGLKGRE